MPVPSFFYIYKKNSHLIPQRSNCDLKFLLHCNFFMFQTRVLKLAYLDSLSFSNSKYIYFYIIMTITQVMSRQMLVTSSDLKVPEVISLEP